MFGLQILTRGPVDMDQQVRDVAPVGPARHRAEKRVHGQLPGGSGLGFKVKGLGKVRGRWECGVEGWVWSLGVAFSD